MHPRTRKIRTFFAREEIAIFSPVICGLYGMSGDVKKRKNICKQHPEVVEKLKKLLAQYINNTTKL